MSKADAITNVEIADCMLRAGCPVTVRRILELLEQHHPALEVNVTFVRARLAAFERSRNVICIVNKDARPATYHMLQVNQEFFRGARKGRPLDFSHTIIPKKSRGTEDDSFSAFAFELWNHMVRKRGLAT